jgi:hypothetical protein
MSSGLALIMLLALLVTSAGCMPGLEPGPESEAADAAGETAEQAASETTTLEAETASAPSESSPWSRRPFSLSGAPRISVGEVEAIQEAGRHVTFIDVRQRSRFDDTHIAGALSIPVAEIDARLEELPRDDLIVPY